MEGGLRPYRTIFIFSDLSTPKAVYRGARGRMEIGFENNSLSKVTCVK